MPQTQDAPDMLASASMASLLDYPRLMEVAEQRQAEYSSNQPFPHTVIDDFLPEEVLALLIEHFPSSDDLVWSSLDAKDRDGRPAQQHKLDFSLGRKDLQNELSLHPVIRYLMLELNSATFLRFLQKLTGIRRLVTDPKMMGGGLHQTMGGGMLRVHADFIEHPIYHFDRRINLLIYLNDRWESAWGGQIELWDKEMANCIHSVDPVANRCLIFNTSMTSYHGCSQPLQCPPGESRKSMAMYYYTVNEQAADKGKTTLTETYWQKMPDE